jgi:hypothetical protein
MFTGQTTIEQKQEKHLRDEQQFKDDNRHTPSCAWCLSEQSIPAGEESHDICSKHANWLLLQQKQLHNRRIATSSSPASKYVACIDSNVRGSQASHMMTIQHKSTHHTFKPSHNSPLAGLGPVISLISGEDNIGAYSS